MELHASYGPRSCGVLRARPPFDELRSHFRNRPERCAALLLLLLPRSVRFDPRISLFADGRLFADYLSTLPCKLDYRGEQVRIMCHYTSTQRARRAY